MFDIRVFSVSYLQNLVRREWRSTGAIQVVGRQGKLYTIFVENEADRNKIFQQGPYAFQGAFFVVDWWRTNSVLRQIVPDQVPLWLQLWDLPLEYQVPSIAQRMASLAGEVIDIDWMNVIPRNIRYMRVRIWIDPHKPLVSGTMLQMDDGRLTKITFSYERVCKICLKCGIIGHTTPHCPHDNMDIERVLNEQMRKIERRRGLHIFYDTQEIPSNSDDFDRPKQFRHHDFSPLPFEVPSAPTRSTMLVEEHGDWRDLDTRRNLFPMDFGLPNPDIAESSQMGALRTTTFTNQTPFSVTNTLATDREVIPPLDVSFNVPINNPLISEVAPDLNVLAALLPTDRTGTLQDIITVHARHVPATLDEWLLCREQLDENNPDLKLTATDGINGSSSFPQVPTTRVPQQPPPTIVSPQHSESLLHLDQTLTPSLSLNTEPPPTSFQPLPTIPTPNLETPFQPPNTQALSTETTPSFIQLNPVDTSDDTKRCFHVWESKERDLLHKMATQKMHNQQVKNLLPRNLEVLYANKNIIHAIVYLGSEKLFYLSAIYGHLVLHKRKQVWNQIKTLHQQVHDEEWLLVGDQVLTENDKFSFKGPSKLAGSEDLLECLNSCNLMDIPGSGQNFTWTNNRDEVDSVWEKLDRVFASISWLTKYDHVRVHNLPVL
ncbi:Endonuclease/exonuclease/phosphatase [Corchorus olitorius]|uniref:Endonuclease/exonuclease/phosphatase n=1 Tax=Corchorus olitorius TaxID=93759 RepID=A0A1R3FXP5_9ROSI|nr:Endonuclease/exonuclease/phosphatase [Corchorus olitorius]